MSTPSRLNLRFSVNHDANRRKVIVTTVEFPFSSTQRSIQVDRPGAVGRRGRLCAPEGAAETGDEGNATHPDVERRGADIHHGREQSVLGDTALDEPRGRPPLSQAIDCGVRLAIRAVSTLLHRFLQIGQAFDLLLL